MKKLAVLFFIFTFTVFINAYKIEDSVKSFGKFVIELEKLAAKDSITLKDITEFYENSKSINKKPNKIKGDENWEEILKAILDMNNKVSNINKQFTKITTFFAILRGDEVNFDDVEFLGMDTVSGLLDFFRGSVGQMMIKMIDDPNYGELSSYFCKRLLNAIETITLKLE